MAGFLEVPNIHVVEHALEGRAPGSLSRDEIMSVLPVNAHNETSMIVRISSTLLVKFGSRVKVAEAKNMIFAATIPTVRVPKVYDVWEVKPAGYVEDDEDALDERSSKITYILMDYVNGNNLPSIWPSKNEAERESIVLEVYHMVKALHSKTLTTPGPIGGGAKSTGFYFSDDGAGPFKLQLDMELWFDTRLKVCQEYRRAPLDQPSFQGCFHPLVMCHLDLHSHNMIVDSKGHLWLLDWESAGAYPDYFEEAFLSSDNYSPGFQTSLKAMLHTSESVDKIRRIFNIGFAVTTAKNLEPGSKYLND